MKHQGLRPVVFALLAAILLLLPAGCAHLSVEEGYVPPRSLVTLSQWPHEGSDLAPDPDTTFGRLPNGLRYLLKENQTPRDRVSMHLYVQVGSLAEHDGEEGLAHFLEHMLFNGSTHFSPGELVKYFQRIGMQFGPDANARTGFAQTVYDILLPRGDAESIAEGLLVLRDFAAGALLLPDQVEKEIPVVLAEKRARDSARYRALEAAFAFEMPDSLPARRFPIGTEAAIESFDEASVREFYDAWYHPERMFLVMVGDFDHATAREWIVERFGDLQPRGAERALPDFGRFAHHGVKAFYHFDRELGATSVSIGTVTQSSTPPDSTDRRRRMLQEEIAYRILQRRLDALLRQPESVMTSVRASAGDYLQQIRYSEITAETTPQQWEETLTTLENTLRQALVHGFAQAELDRARRAYLAELQREADEENTVDSKRLAGAIMDSLGRRHVFQSAAQRLELLAPMLEEMCVAQVNKAFETSWAAPHRLVAVSGNAEIAPASLSTEAYIRQRFEIAGEQPIQPPAAGEAIAFPYLEPPATPGAIARRTVHEDLGIVQIDFANGLRLSLKPTDFKQNEVLAALSFGHGKSMEPADMPGLAQMSQAVVNGSGFGALDRIELEDALAGRLAEISLEVREEMFVVRGEAVPQELPLLFELYHTLLNDPGFQPDALQVALRRFEQQDRALRHSAEGVLQREGIAFLAGGDSRFGWPAWEQLQQVSLGHIARWFGQPLGEAPLELVMVGDFDVEEAVALAARYLGGLPARRESDGRPDRPGPRFPAGQALQLHPDTAMERALLMVAFPTDDFWDIRRTRRLNVLADLLSERLRVGIRENMGAAYSPFAYHRAHRAYQGYGFLAAYLLVDPRQVEAVAAEVDSIVDRLRDGGIADDELRRALDPTLTQIKDLRRLNGYWLNSVLIGSRRHPEQLDWAREMEKDFAAITVDAMNSLAAKYLDQFKAARIVIRPE
ncbi:M16 family metallopeptidase [Desulfatitalea alkaliphila]|uniref:Insulinase family protein n=1 Tax=Desulfatitalea alkaliphila TaxID=2929485 RepID=A0AA41R315_9BACT|nr:M16 family metallopeptidase [Desulfatitalea alkaliphila]MCJ8502157.1 insulinase family protein [Desulfatitalea alkaliphila]